MGLPHVGTYEGCRGWKELEGDKFENRNQKLGGFGGFW
jgi:hypothetical protein